MNINRYHKRMAASAYNNKYILRSHVSLTARWRICIRSNNEYRTLNWFDFLRVESYPLFAAINRLHHRRLCLHRNRNADEKLTETIFGWFGVCVCTRTKNMKLTSSGWIFVPAFSHEKLPIYYRRMIELPLSYRIYSFILYRMHSSALAFVAWTGHIPKNTDLHYWPPYDDPREQHEKLLLFAVFCIISKSLKLNRNAVFSSKCKRATHMHLDIYRRTNGITSRVTALHTT